MNNSVSNSPHHKTTSWGSMGIIAHLDEKFHRIFSNARYLKIYKRYLALEKIGVLHNSLKVVYTFKSKIPQKI
jgi:hypothetical protein